MSKELRVIALERIAAEKVARTGRLHIGNLGLERLPNELFELEWLEELLLGRRHEWFEWDRPNRLAGLPPLLLRLPQLRVFDCSATVLADLSPLAGLRALQSLDCSSTRIADLTPLAGLSALQSLDCSSTRIADLSPLAGLSALQSLDCSSIQVTDLAPLAGLRSLQSLVCGSTQVADLTPLAGLRELQSLNCFDTKVADLAPLAGLRALQSLDCSDTQVSDLAPLAGLTALRSLDCQSTQIVDLAPLAGLKALQWLNCSHTEVADLTAVAGLRALQSLTCWNTEVDDLAPLASLPALRTLDCWEAPVADLPESLIGSATLVELIVGASPGLAEIPSEVLSQKYPDNCLPRLRAHLADLHADAVPLRDLKVIILGNGRIGKTQICRRLRDEPFEPAADSTHGISVTSMELAMPSGQEPATLNLWDFGGQDIYHGTHALFMRTRAIFLLVWTPGSEDGEQEHGGMVFRNRPLPYWLDYVRHLGGAASPVVLVQNQCDGGRGERSNLPEYADPQPFEEDGRLFTRLAYSAKDDIGRARLMEALQLAVTGLREAQGQPLIGRNRLAVWEQLRAWRDADAACPDAAGRLHRLLPFGDFESLCRTAGIHGHETFVEVLHNAGMVFYQRGLFEDQLVLDQSWALNAVYALFTREGGVYRTLRRLSGRFTRCDLDDMLWRGRGLSKADQQSLLGMMVSSGICFVHRRAQADDETEYVAPDLLPAARAALAEEIAARWDPLPGEPLGQTFVYPFLSPSIARAVLSDIGQSAGASALYWRYGVCLYDSGSRASAIVEEVPDAQGYGGQVRIQARGAGAAALLRTLVGRIARLNERSGWSNRLLEGEMPRPRDSIPPSLVPTAPPVIAPAEPEVYVSYAWARERADPLVSELCDTLAGQGLHIRRDTTELQAGDRISHFMGRLSTGRCVVVVLSAAYLRSESCMTELYRIYTNARQQGDEFLGRIVPLVQDDAHIGTPYERAEHAVFWKEEHAKLEALMHQHGAEILGAGDFVRFKLIGEFYRQVGDMLALANDVLLARDRPSLSRDGFAMVRGLIERALG